jgi:hypothetical protein
MSPFEPKGSRALRIIIAEMAAAAKPDDLITFAEFAEAIGVSDDEPGRARVRQAVSAARPILLTDHRRVLVAKRGKGYRVARPGEHAGVAQDHRQRADRQMTKALNTIIHTDESGMTAEELRRHRATGLVIRNLHSRLTSAEQRLQDLEEAVFGSGPPVISGEILDSDS